jgi:uncharacterized protein DUF5995
MRRGAAKCMLAAAFALLAFAPSASAATSTAFGLPDPIIPVPNLNWTSLLPPGASPSNVQPGPVPGCDTPSVACIDHEIDGLAAARRQFGCDHRGVFATTYLTLTKEIRAQIDDTPNLVFDHDYLYTEDALFADFYFDTVNAWNAGDPVPPAWRIAFQAAQTDGITATQDMLLGINAHVQNDMPFVIAALGVRTPDGRSRKPDHDAINSTLNRAYTKVVNKISAEYDPIVGISNLPVSPVDDIAGLELVRGWRELVWRHAEQLLRAKTPEDLARVTKQIQNNAAGWASMIASVRIPGETRNRDAYCAKHLGV